MKTVKLTIYVEIPTEANPEDLLSDTVADLCMDNQKVVKSEAKVTNDPRYLTYVELSEAFGKETAVPMWANVCKLYGLDPARTDRIRCSPPPKRKGQS